MQKQRQQTWHDRLPQRHRIAENTAVAERCRICHGRLLRLLQLLPAVAIPHQVAAVADKMDIAV